MQSSRLLRFGVGLVLTMGLAACLDGTGGGQSNGNAPRGASQTVERDIEAPNVFSKRDAGLWDGRPSLGGVWVAHPDVRDPERVIIRNTENGQETIGALFRRERMNPGPVFQVSADAAAAVAMLAGAPTQIEVIALRTEDVRVGADSPDVPLQADDEQTATAATAAPTQDPARMADTTSAAQQSDDTAIALPPEEDAAQPRRGLFSRIFSRDTQPDAPAGGVETTTLDDNTQTSVAPAMTRDAASPPQPTPSQPAPPATTLDSPFIQLGIFSVEANARRAQEMAGNAGLSARVHAGSTQGNAFWRVTVGPAATSQERQRLLEQVKALGFNDAYAVRR